jgi:hypothetical protein
VVVVLRTIPDLPAPDALVGRVALHLAHDGVAGLAAALSALVDGTGARSAVLRRTGPAPELLATAGEVVQAVSLPRRGENVLEIAVRGPVEVAPVTSGARPSTGPPAPVAVPLAVLTVTGVRPHALPLLRDAAAVLGLVLAGESRLPPHVAGLLADVEAERSALADALHDGPVQELVAARYVADAAVRAGADPGVREALQAALVGLRRTMWQLRPRGADGLADALDRLSAQLVERGAPALRLRVDPAADVLPPTTCMAVYRLVQAVTAGPTGAAGPVATAGPLAAAGPLPAADPVVAAGPVAGPGGPPRDPVTVRLSRQDAPGGRSVVMLSVDGGAPLADPVRWRRTAAALGGDLLACHGRLRLLLPDPASTARDPGPVPHGPVPTDRPADPAPARPAPAAVRAASLPSTTTKATT